ncbi:hypothetical protein HK11_07700 [Acetobacter sp. DmW_043]|uniref:hypothetical protein n=1 Tax=Acetobacter sp. DmW_043 TaxID=1670658 RepID=UPI000A3BBDE9|nr:hypothetical protein [Acetobacter sp. DmW_043]OUI88160.1 hypothetical protein HK11_07700 [Acetobacter sp. DmW_043]
MSNSIQTDPALQNLLQELQAYTQSSSSEASPTSSESNTSSQLSEIFQELMSLLEKGSSGTTSGSSEETPTATTSTTQPSETTGTATPNNTSEQDDTSGTSAGSGANTLHITNTSDHDEKIGEFLNGGSTTTPVAEIDLKPGQSGTLKYQNGQGGYAAEADSSGTYQSTASRLEFYASNKGVNSVDVSYIDGRNAAIKVSDGKGKTAGDSESIASDAPAADITKDAGGRATITGWYDGSTQAMQSGGAYMESKLGTGNSYIHPDDDRNASGSNPMTMAEDTSQTYTADFGDA